MRNLITVASLAVSVLSAPSPATAQRPRPDRTDARFLAITAPPVPMDRDTVFRDATIVVRDGRIADLGSSANVTVPRGAKRIDGRGKWVIPGLVDMHAHLYADEWVPDSVARYELGVYLAQGVTTARLMIGTPLHHRLRADIEAGGCWAPSSGLRARSSRAGPIPIPGSSPLGTAPGGLCARCRMRDTTS
jgi:hypothetical protein